MLKNSRHEPNPLLFPYCQAAHSSGGVWDSAQGPPMPIVPFHKSPVLPWCSELELRGKQLPQATACSLCVTAAGSTVVWQRYYTAQALGTQPRNHNLKGSLATATGGGWQLCDGAFTGLQPCSAFMFFFSFCWLETCALFQFHFTPMNPFALLAEKHRMWIKYSQ